MLPAHRSSNTTVARAALFFSRLMQAIEVRIGAPPHDPHLAAAEAEIARDLNAKAQLS